MQRNRCTAPGPALCGIGHPHSTSQSPRGLSPRDTLGRCTPAGDSGVRTTDNSSQGRDADGLQGELCRVQEPLGESIPRIRTKGGWKDEAGEEQQGRQRWPGSQGQEGRQEESGQRARPKISPAQVKPALGAGHYGQGPGGSTPKSYPGGVPLRGAFSLEAIKGCSKYMQRAACPQPPVNEAGVFPPKPPGFEKPVEASLFESKPREQILGTDPKDSLNSSVPTGAMKKGAIDEFVGKGLYELGRKLHQWVLEVSSLRGKSMGRMKNSSLFPLPTSRETLSCSFSDLTDLDLSWLSTLCVCLNSFYGCELLHEGTMTRAQFCCLELMVKDVCRLKGLNAKLENFDWSAFFSTRSIDYKGDEVKTARSFCWSNIKPALPPEVGRVPLEEVCSLGSRFYVENFDLFIKKPDACVMKKAPRVMVADEHWGEVCTGLAGVCTMLPVDELYHINGRPLLNGLFGVTKDEWQEGVEVFRLIMNMIPLNTIAEPLKGDVDTLPMWSLMTPYFIQPDELLLVSSEDVRCFFYTMAVPSAWFKYMGFNKRVPPECVPSHLCGQEVYLAATVLPMGFLNSVSLAQHVHRTLALWSGEATLDEDETNLPENEIRKDRPITAGNPSWRIYLDNYDLLERVKAIDGTSLTGTVAPGVLSLRQQYEHWEVPRNLKKSVSRDTMAEVQGAQVDGVNGVAFPREVKLIKYVAATMALVESKVVTQKQMQVVCGGLVYISMFKRPLLGTLNAVWRFIHTFQHPQQRRRLPDNCIAELIRFLGLVPLAKLDFRLDYNEQVTCSDASTTGGGICASAGVSPLGRVVAGGKLRGELPELRSEHRVLSIGLFDGIGALRVALDLLGVELVGHISVEQDPQARRVVEAHFPEVIHVEDVNLVDEDMVHQWAGLFSQAAVVVLGGGPPCQGVSGLNASRRGALRDERSSLFSHVRRIWDLVSKAFPWCQVHCLMESVSSMDACDRDIMSADFGCQPWLCQANHLTWCNRPRFYWLSWQLVEQEGVTMTLPTVGCPGEVVPQAWVDLETCCKEGWIKVDPDKAFPTFTTSRPRTSPGHKPAGLGQCSVADLERWKADSFRYPPYQYQSQHLLVSKTNEVRFPAIDEKEYIMGFPVGYTKPCCVKSERGTAGHSDKRHCLIGNTWCVPVVAFLLGSLFYLLGLCPLYSPQQLMDMLDPVQQTFLQSRLWRQPLRPLRGAASETGTNLVRRLGIKGEDILLTTPSSQLTKFHRLRASIPSRLWRWKVVSGWSWSGQAEHINSLELRAVLTTLKWRIEHKLQVGCRFLHLVDSLVVLHALSRGRSSSRKLRATLGRVNALLLCSSTQALWGYVHTDLNPADKPSRWGKRVRTKFRNA